MSDKTSRLPATSTEAEVAAFLEKVRSAPKPAAGPRGRLLFAMDATASREPTWDRACRIQGEMFEATKALGGLEIQLAFFRGFGEFRATPWLASAAELVRRMTGVFCLAGSTQIEKVLRHAVAETKARRVNALVYVGDCMEEDVDRLCGLAGELGLLGVPAFLFHEGDDPVAARAFKQIARLTGGAYCPFDSRSARQLAELLRAVAVYAAGGLAALEDLAKRGGGAARIAGYLERSPRS
ncbi:MAG: VWA domain-containing protein [Alphaproteobacteria bacterium]